MGDGVSNDKEGQRANQAFIVYGTVDAGKVAVIGAKERALGYALAASEEQARHLYANLPGHRVSKVLSALEAPVEDVTRVCLVAQTAILGELQQFINAVGQAVLAEIAAQQAERGRARLGFPRGS